MVARRDEMRRPALRAAAARTRLGAQARICAFDRQA